MTKRGKIREGIAIRLGITGVNPPKEHWNMAFSKRRKDVYFKWADDLLQYLHSQGVVIKVDRELPLVYIEPAEDFMLSFKMVNEIVRVHQQDMLKWHNDSLEPLVKE